jgi:hypothetical protein
VRSPRTAGSATFSLNVAACVRRVLFVIFWFPLPAFFLAQIPAAPLTGLPRFSGTAIVSTAECGRIIAYLDYRLALQIERNICAWGFPLSQFRGVQPIHATW